jgi:hypothetical protein
VCGIADESADGDYRDTSTNRRALVDATRRIQATVHPHATAARTKSPPAGVSSLAYRQSAQEPGQTLGEAVTRRTPSRLTELEMVRGM